MVEVIVPMKLESSRSPDSPARQVVTNFTVSASMFEPTVDMNPYLLEKVVSRKSHPK